jgi:lysophospholipase L1-like esterase
MTRILNRILALGLIIAAMAGPAFAQTGGSPFIGAVPAVITQLPVAQVQGGTSFSPLQLPRWRACLAKLRNGLVTGCPVPWIGDSTLYGIGGTSNSGTGTQLNLTDFVSLYLNQAGIPANNNGICGDGSIQSAQLRIGAGGTDQRFTGTWGTGSGLHVTLGGYIMGSSTNGATETFTPITSFNSTAAALYPAMTPNAFNVIWYNNSSAGTFTATATGGSAVTMSGSGTGAYQTTQAVASSVSAANAVVLTTTAASSGPFFVCVEAVNTNIPSVDLINAGSPGGFMADWVGAANLYSPNPTVTYLNAPLVVIIPGLNDWKAGNSLATFIANLTAFIANAETTSDVILVSPTPNASNPALETQYIAAEKNVAQQFNIPFVDLNTIMVSAASMNSLGLGFGDGIHPNSPGYADEAREIANVMVQP